MRSAREGKRKAARHGEQAILFSVGGHSFACPAAAVDEIRPLDGLRPLPAALAHGRLERVKCTLEREGRTWFVVDANLHFHLLPSRPARLLLLRDEPVALLVDAIDRMAEVAAIHPLPRAFRGEERQWFRGLALLGEAVIPVVNPACFLSQAEVAVAAAELARARAVSA